MKRRAAVIACILFCMSVPLAAASPAQIPLNCPIYQEMDTHYRLTGRPLPSSSRPRNSAEAVQLLEAIPADGPYSALQSTIAARLNAPSINRVSDSFAWRITPTIAAEAYLHTNPSDFKTYSDWMYSYDERRPMLDLGVAMQYGNTFYFATSLEGGGGSVFRDA